MFTISKYSTFIFNNAICNCFFTGFGYNSTLVSISVLFKTTGLDVGAEVVFKVTASIATCACQVPPVMRLNRN